MAATSPPMIRVIHGKHTGRKLDADLEALLDKAQELLVQQKAQESKPGETNIADGSNAAGVVVTRKRPGTLPKGPGQGARVARMAACSTGARWQGTKKNTSMAQGRGGKVPTNVGKSGADRTDAQIDEAGFEATDQTAEGNMRKGLSHHGSSLWDQQWACGGEAQRAGSQNGGSNTGIITNFVTQV
ncbi:hypothetical protein NDU88_006636 [Pleurodeles waltl]|uniref:Uncharacterized protein n=1 Tax=Pleurodeles waltl TaxID=8319 RepID=A0AAV7WG75_PLEWA|nr:hypothetical protein NDU88_006636 [Pleurodeles waltl]